MAFYALFLDEVVLASEAIPRQGYRCIECGSSMRLRGGGGRRQAHFFHEMRSPLCRIYGKSERHEQIQCALQRAYPSLELELEVPFPTVGRIADLYTAKEKRVFEIQCSWIRPEEVERRREDYRLLGLDLVWLLDDRLYNKKRYGKAEASMRRQGGYFFTFAQQRVHVYDQIEGRVHERRISKKTPFWVNLGEKCAVAWCMESRPLPRLLCERTEHQASVFVGDVIEQATRERVEARVDSELQWLLSLEGKWKPTVRASTRVWRSWIWRFLDYLSSR